ncbi:hypothetical protein E1281_07945 [Actinomadura sp. KC345]|uniref:hypothetical protein n=1 Tax=Actinomadura sp. KC345 TaxID=2530371 RepID=UPI001047D43C|nr:hypothetical protein [Actinomadura sp. KC345]TDC56274.1 hypothetical protein E1281_07945 [Actinomadura sp. KC345]
MNVPVAIRASAERLMVAATMGPTIHHVHAWRFKVASGLIEVHADPGRLRPERDPSGRSLHLSSGAALVNLRLAAAQLGREAVVRLLPDAGRPTVLATVRLAGRHRITREERLLYAATLRPFIGAKPVECARPSASLVSRLGELAKLEGAALHPLPSAPDAMAQRAVLTTYGDSPAEWLRAGQALQRLLLSGTVHAVSTSFTFDVDIPGVESVTQPGEVTQVLLDLAQHVDVRRLLKPPVARQHEGQRRWQRVG